MIRVVVVEDSPVVREFLVHVLNLDSQLRVVATAVDGMEGVEVVRRLKPDVITMDINMPRMNGFEATRQIMEIEPTPIVLVSASWDPSEVEKTFQALDAGALTVLPKPPGPGHPESQRTVQELLQTVRLMSEVKVVRRWARTGPKTPTGTAPALASAVHRRTGPRIEVIALGASTGGPQVFQTIFSGLPKHFPVPLLVVQHMAAGFTQGFVEWLHNVSGIPVHLAADGEGILPGHVYVAPDGFQMKVRPRDRLALTQGEFENGIRPSVSFLFRSVAEVYGPAAVGVLLTGMGKDGAEELRLMRERGGITIAQDSESSVVFGMPGEAVNLNAATYVLSPLQIVSALLTLT